MNLFKAFVKFYMITEDPITDRKLCVDAY